MGTDRSPSDDHGLVDLVDLSGSFLTFTREVSEGIILTCDSLLGWSQTSPLDPPDPPNPAGCGRSQPAGANL